MALRYRRWRSVAKPPPPPPPTGEEKGCAASTLLPLWGRGTPKGWRGPRRLPRVSQPRGHAVDRQVHPVADGLAVLAGAQAADQFDLQVVERVDVGQARADDRGKVRVLVQQLRLAGDLQHRLDRALPL